MEVFTNRSRFLYRNVRNSSMSNEMWVNAMFHIALNDELFRAIHEIVECFSRKIIIDRHPIECGYLSYQLTSEHYINPKDLMRHYQTYIREDANVPDVLYYKIMSLLMYDDSILSLIVENYRNTGEFMTIRCDYNEVVMKFYKDFPVDILERVNAFVGDIPRLLKSEFMVGSKIAYTGVNNECIKMISYLMHKNEDCMLELMRYCQKNQEPYEVLVENQMAFITGIETGYDVSSFDEIDLSAFLYSNICGYFRIESDVE